MDELIQIQNLSKRYGKGNTEKVVLKNINLTVHKHDFIAIVGPSGSGKTSLINSIGILDDNYQGKIFFNSMDLSELTKTQKSELRKEYIGFLFQKSNLIYNLSVEENIELPLLLSSKIFSPLERKQKIEYLLTTMGISDKKNNNISNLSWGELQRVSFARSVVHNPKVLILDEPTGSLDKENRDIIAKILEDLFLDSSLTILLVTHDLDLANRAQRIIYLKNGNLVDKL